MRRENDDVDVVKTESISNDGDGSFLRSATLPKPSRLSAPPPPPSLELDTRQYNLYRRNVPASVDSRDIRPASCDFTDCSVIYHLYG